MWAFTLRKSLPGDGPAVESGLENRMITRPDAGDWIWLAMAAMCLVKVGTGIRRRKNAGHVLLALGSVDGRVFYLLIGVVLAAASLLAMFFLHRRFWFLLVPFTWGLSLIADAQRRFQIREAGLFGCDSNTIRWEKITGYEISPIGTLSLKLQSKKWTFFCDVPSEVRAEATRILALKCPEAVQSKSEPSSRQ
jgi:hypothetical protein